MLRGGRNSNAAFTLQPRMEPSKESKQRKPYSILGNEQLSLGLAFVAGTIRFYWLVNGDPPLLFPFEAFQNLLQFAHYHHTSGLSIQ